MFLEFENPLEEHWSKNSLIVEIMLLEGFPLDSEIVVFGTLINNQIVQISSHFHEHFLKVCLDEIIHEETIEQLQLKENEIFICLDKAISDQDKIRLSDMGLIKTI